MVRSSLVFGFALVASVWLAASACNPTSRSTGFKDDGTELAADAGALPSPATSPSPSPRMDDSGSLGTVGSFGQGSPAHEGGLPDGAGCATATAEAKKTPVYMVFVLDGSASMQQDGKWAAATQALEAIFADMQMQADPGVGVGLIVFSDTYDFTLASGPYPEIGIDVPIGFVDAAQVRALNIRLSGEPWGDTPTGKALQGGYGELESYVATTPLPSGGQKVLVLITDGVPTDRCAANGSYSANACVVEAGRELAKAGPNGPILTFVIGTGVFPSGDLTNFDPSFLGNLAQSGGTGPSGCNPNENTVSADLCYFEVDPTQGSQTRTEQAFEAAINAIRGQVLSCTFPLSLDAEAGTVDPGKVNVTVDGTTIPQSSTNGWSYDDPVDPTAIILNGPACARIKSDPTASVQIVLGCATLTAQ
jgi:Mg-chelatase subunit ChlD